MTCRLQELEVDRAYNRFLSIDHPSFWLSWKRKRFCI